MKTKYFALLILALTLCVGAIFLSGTALASGSDAQQVLSVDSAWLEGDTLYMDVTNTQTGAAQTLTISLADYAGSTDEYISIQAVDADGNTSNTVRFQNPYYQPTAADSADVTPEPPTQAEEDTPALPAQTGIDVPETTETPLPNDSGTFTPDGTGTVMDNATDGDGKEFYTVSTVDGNVFYLIIDRQRSTDNVYLLNAVTEDDLASLAKLGDGKTSSAVPSTTVPTPTSEPVPTASPPAANTEAKSGGISGGALIFIIIIVLAAGGAGYYFKILKPKRQAAEDDEEEYEDEPGQEDDYDEPDDGYADDDGEEDNK